MNAGPAAAREQACRQGPPHNSVQPVGPKGFSPALDPSTPKQRRLSRSAQTARPPARCAPHSSCWTRCRGRWARRAPQRAQRGEPLLSAPVAPCPACPASRGLPAPLCPAAGGLFLAPGLPGVQPSVAMLQSSLSLFRGCWHAPVAPLSPRLCMQVRGGSVQDPERKQQLVGAACEHHR